MQKQKEVRLIEFRAPFVESFLNIIFAATLGWFGAAVSFLLRAVMSKSEVGSQLVLAVSVVVGALTFVLIVGVVRASKLQALVHQLELAL